MRLPSYSDDRTAPGARPLRSCDHADSGEHGIGRRLFGSSLVELYDGQCLAGMNPSWGAEQVGCAHEVHVVRRGAFARDLEGSITLVHSGLAAFTNPGESFRIAHPVPGGDVRSTFRLSAEGVRALAVEGGDEQAGESTRFANPDALIDGPAFLQHQLALYAARQSGTDPLAGLAAEERALSFLFRVMYPQTSARSGSKGHYPREARNRRAREYVMRVREIIAARYREPLSLRKVAELVGCSLFHLSRVVAAYEGVPIYRLIVQQRLRHSLERVLGSRDSLSGIALEMGFASHSHFGDSFRREFGCAPGVARLRTQPGSARSRAPWLGETFPLQKPRLAE